MGTSPSEITLQLTPKRRLDIIDVNQRLREQAGDFLNRHNQAFYCSYHTTAGYLEQSLCERLGSRRDSVHDFMELFQEIFPPEADYQHDRMHLRTELSPEQRRTEPRNADSHLTFIGSGLENCVTYACDPKQPVYFIDLDGINRDNQDRRERHTTVIGFNEDRTVEDIDLTVPVSPHPIDSVSLRDPRLGLFDQLHEQLARYDITKGRIDIDLAADEKHAGLTVNEYETLLMRNDLPAAMRHPLRYVLRSGKRLLRDPGSLAGKARDYAVYDLLHLYNEIMDVLGVGRSVADRILSRLSGPAHRLFRLKRRVSYLLSSNPETGPDRIVEGQYQSPILIQHRPSDSGSRRLDVVLWRFR